MKHLALGAALSSFMVPSQAAMAAEEEGFTIGGALRYNIYSKSWENNPDATQFTWDTWRLNVDGTKGGIDLSFEYRFYPDSDAHFIHHGYFGYQLDEDLYGKLGVFQKPFGITTYASHSWWFQTPYYVGLEDDYDMGVGLDYTPTEDLELQLAYFRQAEPNGSLDGENDIASRYSYDVVATEDADLKELNTINARVAYQLTPCWEVGASAQVGQLYNSELDDSKQPMRLPATWKATWATGTSRPSLSTTTTTPRITTATS